MATSKAKFNFVQLSQNKYETLGTWDANTLYFCQDSKRIYKGQVLFSRPAQVVQALPEVGLVETVYICTSNGTINYYDTSWHVVSGSQNGVSNVNISNGKLSVTGEGGTVEKSIGGLFKSFSYNNGVLKLSVSNDEGESNSTSEYNANIPVEQYLQGVSRKEVSSSDLIGTDSSVYAGCVAGDIGILFNMVDGSKMFVKLSDLIDTYVPSNSNASAITVSISGYNISADLKFDQRYFEKDFSGNLLLKSQGVKSLIAVSGTLENEVALFNSDGNVKSSSGKKIGGAALATTTDANTLATEKAVEDAISWTIITD